METKHKIYNRSISGLPFLLFVMIFQSEIVKAKDGNVRQDTAVYSAVNMGTAWALTPRHVVTNLHVINGAKNVMLISTKHKEIPVRLVLADKKNDLAVLYITDKKVQIKPLLLALKKPQLGSQVFTIGYPHPNLMGTSPKLTSGFINATTGLADDPRMYQVSVPVQSGNSGGPLLNMQGEVVGIITSKLSAQKMFEWTGDVPQNVNYAIKINQLRALMNTLKTDEQVVMGSTENKQDQNLESLASILVDSVILVAADGNKQKNVINNSLFVTKQETVSPDIKNSKRIMLYSFAEPGNYDVSERIKGSNTVATYSKNTLDILKKNLEKHLGGDIEFIAHSGDDASSLYYKIEDKSYNKTLCNNNKINNILASYSEREPGAPFRHVSFRMIDCLTLREFTKEYMIERDERNDRFGYEVAIHTSFKDFILKTPPYVSWDNAELKK